METKRPESGFLPPPGLSRRREYARSPVCPAGMKKLALVSILAAGCATTQMPEREQLHSSLYWTNQARELSTSVWVAPFFRDESRRLLTLDPPDEVELLVTPDGKPIKPGEAMEVLPAGTRVTVLAVEFPTRWQTIARPLMTPRDQPWLQLAVEGRDPKTPYVVVLPPGMLTAEETTKRVDRWLARPGIASEVGALSETDRQMIATKQLAVGASRRGLELAFGPPNTRKVHGEGSSVVEAWTWVSDLGVKRTAHLRDAVVERVETPQ